MTSARRPPVKVSNWFTKDVLKKLFYSAVMKGLKIKDETVADLTKINKQTNKEAST